MARKTLLAIGLGAIVATLALTTGAQENTPAPGHGQSGHGTHAESPYAGDFDPDAAIRALTPDEIARIERGEGAGYAKAAELNGVPGPRHVLGLQDELDLTADQLTEVETIFAGMRETVIVAGEAYLAAQLALETDFRTGKLTGSELPGRVSEVARLEAALASGHLAAHLQTAEALTADQIAAYNRLRGYA